MKPMPSAPLWTAADAAKAVAGTCSGSWTATGISIDSRTVGAGDLFIALKGPSFDGHGFVVEALKRGAAAAIVHQAVPESAEYHDRLIVVKDTFLALENLARAARARAEAKVIAVTGSVGKTGTKEALKLALAVQGATHATEGNLNNHWGVPLSLARMPASTQFGVFELGMNHPGEIAPLSKLVRPHAAVITTVEAAHLEFFASVADIAEEKAAIMAGLEPAGVAVLPSDNPHYGRLSAAAKRYGAKIVAFGTGGEAGARLFAWSLTPDGTQVAAEFDDERIMYDMIVSGRHWALNSIAAIAAVKAIGGNIHLAAAALARLAAPVGRGARKRIRVADGKVLLIDESYNASPAAVRVLADTMAQMHQPVGGALGKDGGRLIMVLGDMRELGAKAAELHAGLADSLKAARIDLVYTAGPMMKHLHNALPEKMRGAHAPDAVALVGILQKEMRAGDVVAVKGSHASRMDLVVEALGAQE